jgi:hypothetical protein
MTDATPPDTSSSVSSFENRVAAAMSKVGVNEAEVKAVVLAKLEAAADAYERATIPADQDFWHAEAIRFRAALAAL